MAVERAAGGSSLIDVLDRVLDKGIVIDAWVRVSLVGIDLITVEARVVVASIDTYLKYSEAVGQSVPVARPALESRPYDELAAENQALRAELSDASGTRQPVPTAAASGSVALNGEENDEAEGAACRPSAARLPARQRRRLPAKQSRHDAVEEAASPVAESRGKYVYCVIQSADPLKFGAAGIGDNGSEIHTVHYRDLAAVVSDVPLGILDSTRENVLAHERVNEIVMRDHTVIPMSFGTIFKTKDDIVQLLRSAYDAFGDVLSKMRDKMEFGLKVLWDRDSVVKDIEDEDEGIHRLKNEIALQKGSTYFARMQYGRAIDAALQSRSERYGTEILDRLRDVAVASRINKPIGDKMIMNAAFLVSRDQEAAFDSRVKSIAAEHDKLTFKYTGPWPPYNFVNIRLKLERV